MAVTAVVTGSAGARRAAPAPPISAMALRPAQSRSLCGNGGQISRWCGCRCSGPARSCGLAVSVIGGPASGSLINSSS